MAAIFECDTTQQKAACYLTRLKSHCMKARTRGAGGANWHCLHSTPILACGISPAPVIYVHHPCLRPAGAMLYMYTQGHAPTHIHKHTKVHKHCAPSGRKPLWPAPRPDFSMILSMKAMLSGVYACAPGPHQQMHSEMQSADCESNRQLHASLTASSNTCMTYADSKNGGNKPNACCFHRGIAA